MSEFISKLPDLEQLGKIIYDARQWLSNSRIIEQTAIIKYFLEHVLPEYDKNGKMANKIFPGVFEIYGINQKINSIINSNIVDEESRKEIETYLQSKEEV